MSVTVLVRHTAVLCSDCLPNFVATLESYTLTCSFRLKCRGSLCAVPLQPCQIASAALGCRAASVCLHDTSVLCPPVCLSVTFVYCVETSKHLLKLLFTVRYRKTTILVLFSLPSVILTFRQRLNWGKIAIVDQYLALG